jgi:hypothetical protein
MPCAHPPQCSGMLTVRLCGRDGEPREASTTRDRRAVSALAKFCRNEQTAVAWGLSSALSVLVSAYCCLSLHFARARQLYLISSSVMQNRPVNCKRHANPTWRPFPPLLHITALARSVNTIRG